MLSYAELRAEKPDPEVYLVGPELLAKRGKLILGAPEKNNKSWFLMNAALDLVAGRNLWGVPEFVVARPLRVAYFDKELGKSRIKKRLAFIEKTKPIDPDWAARFWIESGDPMCLLNNEMGPFKITGLLHERNVDVVIFDPISKFYPGSDENSVRDMSKVTYNIDKILAETGCAAMLSHHEAKPSPETVRKGAQRLRGSSALAGDLDTYIRLSLKSAWNHMNQNVQLAFVTRDLPIEPFYCRRTDAGTIEYLGFELPNTRPRPPENYSNVELGTQVVREKLSPK